LDLKGRAQGKEKVMGRQGRKMKGKRRKKMGESGKGGDCAAPEREVCMLHHC